MTDSAPPIMSLSTGGILGRTFALLGANLPRAFVAMVVMSLLGALVDLGFVENGGLLILNLATFVMQYWLIASLLDAHDLRVTDRPRLPAFFLLGIATTLGILAGLVLLVIPGIFLMVRWSISGPAVIGSDLRVFDAIGYSWRETESHFWPILGAFMVVFVPGTAAALAGYFIQSEGALEVGVAVFELAFNGAFIIGWHMSSAIYIETRRESRYAEVFA